MVTAETAMVIPALLAVLVVGLSAIGLGIDHVRCIDAARVAVREAARTTGGATSLEEAQRSAPEGARIDLATSGSVATATVSYPAPEALAWILPAPRCTSSARVESTVEP